jgi:hypothetical protein
MKIHFSWVRVIKAKYLILVVCAFFIFNLYFKVGKEVVEIKKTKQVNNKIEFGYDTTYKDVYLDDRQNAIYSKVALKTTEKRRFRIHIPNGRSPESLNKDYYLIYEGSKFYGNAKFCHMKYNSRLLGF